MNVTIAMTFVTVFERSHFLSVVKSNPEVYEHYESHTAGESAAYHIAEIAGQNGSDCKSAYRDDERSLAGFLEDLIAALIGIADIQLFEELFIVERLFVTADLDERNDYRCDKIACEAGQRAAFISYSVYDAKGDNTYYAQYRNYNEKTVCPVVLLDFFSEFFHYYPPLSLYIFLL